MFTPQELCQLLSKFPETRIKIFFAHDMLRSSRPEVFYFNGRNFRGHKRSWSDRTARFLHFANKNFREWQVSKIFMDINFCRWSVFKMVKLKRRKDFLCNHVILLDFLIDWITLEITPFTCITSLSMSII